MKILEWTIQNYKSYGNTKTTITLNPDKAELILVASPNGGGKSSLINSLDLGMFGEEQNKRGTKLAKGNFPNRTNGNMFVNVKCQTDQILDITRTMSNVSAPLKTKLVIDKIPYDKANKVDEKIIEKIGFDFKTYKSFISMNINNFKNFISLTPEDKRILLDKLFNLEQINELNKILKQLQKTNDTSFSSIAREINIYKENVKELQETIDAINEKNKINNDSKIKELKTILDTKKIVYVDLEESKEKIKASKVLIKQSQKDIQEDINAFVDGINKLKIKKSQIDRDISDINEKIELYNIGKCPTCLTELVGDLNLLPEYTERLEKTTEILNKVKLKITNATKELAIHQTDFSDINKQLSKFDDESDIIDTDLNKIIKEVTTLKTELKSLKIDKNDDLTGFNTNIESTNDKIIAKEETYLELQKLKFTYDILLPLWSESGIKRDIIDSIIDPLNQFIMEDLIHIKTRFRVELDNNFDAHIYEYNLEIDPETLSSGEAKKVNIIIMLAYIKILRMKRDINVLFLDEVFATIDIESVDDILILFKKFVDERNVNVFLVHHSELKEWFFDRIIKVHKNTFSYLEEKRIN